MAAETYIMRKPHGRLSLVALAGNVIYLGFRVQGPRDRHTPRRVDAVTGVCVCLASGPSFPSPNSPRRATPGVMPTI